MDGQRNFPDEQEHRWFPADSGYRESEWRSEGQDRYRAEEYRAPETSGGTGGDSRYGGRDGAEEERFRSPLGTSSEFGGRYGESVPYGGGEPSAGTTSGYAGARPDGPGLPPQGGPPVTSGAPLGDPAARAGDVGGGRAGNSVRSMDAQTGSMPPVAAGPGEPPNFATESIDRSALRRPPGAGGPGEGNGVYRTRRPSVAILIAVLTVLLEIPALRLLLAGTVADPVSASGVIAGTLMVIGLPILAAGLHGLTTGAVPAADPARFWLRPPTAYLTVAFVLFAAAGLAAA